MSVTAYCCKCGKGLQAADKYAGWQVRCPNCQTLNQFPKTATGRVAPKQEDRSGNPRQSGGSIEAPPFARGMDFRVVCPCGFELRCGVDQAEKLAQCPRCGRVYRIGILPGMDSDAVEVLCPVCGESFSREGERAPKNLAGCGFCHSKCWETWRSELQRAASETRPRIETCHPTPRPPRAVGEVIRSFIVDEVGVGRSILCLAVLICLCCYFFGVYIPDRQLARQALPVYRALRDSAADQPGAYRRGRIVVLLETPSGCEVSEVMRSLPETVRATTTSGFGTLVWIRHERCNNGRNRYYIRYHVSVYDVSRKLRISTRTFDGIPAPDLLLGGHSDTGPPPTFPVEMFLRTLPEASEP